MGDDRTRFAAARALKTDAGAAPITRASGRSRAVVHSQVKNHRLDAVGYIWACASLTASPGAPHPLRPAQRARRPALRRTAQPLQPLPRLPFHCLATRQTYSEHLAFPVTAPGGSTAPRPPRTAAAVDA
ncbi:hypothetical protein [Sphaerisporangium rhizosphaerae]|uniref:Uncharacterized protein n=1 Tax=Sphaerisporangium rhizosphaerae TaxID=2269375 RepID=A0ABW2P3E2_9ACTN